VKEIIMRTRTRIATGIATGALAAALIATPSLAATMNDASNGDTVGHGWRVTQQQTTAGAADATTLRTRLQDGTCDGTGLGTGAQYRGAGAQNRGSAAGAMGAGAGSTAALSTLASGTLTDAQKSELAAMAEEEKLAHDLYVAFGDAFGTRSFTQIASAETRHLTEVRFVLDRYGIADPTDGLAAGTFASTSTQSLYNELLASGSASVEAAYTAARTVESTDIADLKSAMSSLDAPDVSAVYTHLLAGSEQHLAAFGG
jgi:hypothetical protein